MNNQTDVINELTNELLITLGLGGFIFVVIVGWIIWFFFNQKVNRIEKTFTSELEKSRATELDLLYRRREVYSRLVKSMRVFLQKADPTETSSDEKKNEFLAAYDEMYIWAPDEVLESLGKLIDSQREWAKRIKKAKSEREQIPTKEVEDFQKTFRELHSKCLEQIRHECGFDETDFEYRYISF